MSAFRVYLFREFTIQNDEIPFASIENRKAKELFAYLMLNSHRPHRREALMSLLWQESTTEKAQRNMRQVLWHLQHSFDETHSDDEQRVLLIDGEWLRLNPQIEFWCDVHQFQNAFRLVQDKSGLELESLVARDAQMAIDLYRGELLEGWEHYWCLVEREHLQNLFLMLLDKMMDYCEHSGRFEEGISYGVQALKIDVARERTYRRLMRAYALLGDRNTALRHYVQCTTALDHEYQLEPSSNTQELYAAILNGKQFSAGKSIRSQRIDQSPPVGKNVADLLEETIQILNDLEIGQRQIVNNIMTIARRLRHS